MTDEEFRLQLAGALSRLGAGHELIQAFWGAYRWRLTQSDYVREGAFGMREEIEYALVMVPSALRRTSEMGESCAPQPMDQATFGTMADGLALLPVSVIRRLRMRIEHRLGSEDAMNADAVLKHALEGYVLFRDGGLCPGPG